MTNIIPFIEYSSQKIPAEGQVCLSKSPCISQMMLCAQSLNNHSFWKKKCNDYLECVPLASHGMGMGDSVRKRMWTDSRRKQDDDIFDDDDLIYYIPNTVFPPSTYFNPFLPPPISPDPHHLYLGGRHLRSTQRMFTLFSSWFPSIHAWPIHALSACLTENPIIFSL